MTHHPLVSPLPGMASARDATAELVILRGAVAELARLAFGGPIAA